MKNQYRWLQPVVAPAFGMSPSGRSGWLTALTVALLVALTAAFWDYTQDDVFITYAYSRNIASGDGFVFNPGEHVQGTTTPLYALLMAGVHFFTNDLLHAGNVVSALCLGLTIFLAMRLLRRFVSRSALWVQAMLLVTAPLAYISFGMESLFYSALLVLALALWARDRRLLAALAAAALTWTRADGVVLGLTLPLAALLDTLDTGGMKRSLPAAIKESLLLGGVYVLGIAPWFLFAQAYFGTVLPQTFDAKQEFLQGTAFLAGAGKWWASLYGSTWYGAVTLLSAPLILVGIASAARSRALRPLALWTVAYLLGYTALNVTEFWYYTPLLVACVVLAVLGGDHVAQALIQRGVAPRMVMTVVVVLTGLTMLAGVRRAWDYHNPPPRMKTYELVGKWIAAHTEPESTLTVKDLGVVGYYARRHVIDSYGLIVPDLFVASDAYANAKYKTDYSLTTQYWELQRLSATDWFRYHYRPVVAVSTAGDTEFSPMTLHQRRLALVTPAQTFQGMDLPLTCTLEFAEGALLPRQTSARLLDRSGNVVAETAHPFLWDQYPGARTLGAETLIEQIALPLAVPPGVYTWELDCGENPDPTRTGEVTVSPITATDDYTELAPASWGEFARLVGFAAPEGLTTWSGGSLALLLHWQALGTANRDYSLFLHLVDSDGRLWAQADGSPCNSACPVSTWAAGDTILDARRIMLPADLPEGTYSVLAGWYDWQTGDRVAVATTGDPLDALPLPLVITNRWPGGSGLP